MSELTPEQQNKIDEFIREHKPGGDWLTIKVAMGEPIKVPQFDQTSYAVLCDFMYAYIWAARMLGIGPGHDTHEPFLEAVAQVAMARAALAARDRQLAELRKAMTEAVSVVTGEGERWEESGEVGVALSFALVATAIGNRFAALLPPTAKGEQP